MDRGLTRCVYLLAVVVCGCADPQAAEPQPAKGDAAARGDSGSTPAASDAQLPRRDAEAPRQDAAAPRPDAQAPAQQDAQAAREDAAARADAQAQTPSESDAAAPARPVDAGAQAAARSCKPRKVEGADGVRFHHIHFNSVTPDEDLAFYEKFFAAPPVDFCEGENGGPNTRATRTDRGWFLYTKVAEAPDARLNAYLEHIGWIHSDPAAELQRLVQAGAPLFPMGRGQCDTAFMGTAPCSNYWFYLQAPNGARVEVARGPGPATTGFGHVHLFMGTDYLWFEP